MSAADTNTATQDPAAALDEGRRAALAAVADVLIPQAHGMPSAGDVIGEARLRFVLGARPDLAEPLARALRSELGDDPATRLATLAREEPDALAALQLVIVGGYYTDKDVRERIGYPGQLAKTIAVWRLPDYVQEGLIDQVLARGPVWRDPRTGRTSVQPIQSGWLTADAPDPAMAAAADAPPRQ